MSEGNVEVKTTKKRWLQLAFFSLMTFLNGMTWITFSPISDQVQSRYSVSITSVNMLSLIFLILYIVFFLPSSWCLDRKGLRFGLIIGSSLTIIGAAIRPFGQWGFGLVFFGQAICGIGQPFLLSAAPKLAQNWFPDHQRALATTIASVANPLGTGLGFLLPPLLVSSPSDIPLMLLIEGVIVAVILIPCTILLKDKPEHPPSYTASIGSPMMSSDLITNTKKLFTDINFILLFCEFGLGLGTFNAIATVINQLVQPYGYSNDDAGNLGALFIVFGLIGCGIASVIVDKFKNFKLILVIAYVLAVASTLLFVFILKPDNFALLAFSTSVMGFSMTPTLPLSLELGCEIAHPIGEATVSNYLLAMGQLVGIGVTLGFGAFVEANNIIGSIWMVFALYLTAGLCILFFRGQLKRSNQDKEKKIELEKQKAQVESQVEDQVEDQVESLGNSAEALLNPGEISEISETSKSSEMSKSSSGNSSDVYNFGE
eukprot:TRINITY_DN3057_c0_g2_i1.p1 TRINITY_DN3057_c0_g2~~TRINITY_DN3057_c0_g2_i1.p1  ORF type:complete len:486 (+),score=149.16 TRINITY_DN3057_c0_g2_i1:29-1486(+)